jgi:hypothetical protein
MSVILLPIYNGLRARNFFLTDLYPELLKGGVKLVVLAPPYKCKYYRKEYGNAQTIFVEWDSSREHWLGKALQWFAFNSLGTGTVREKQYAFYVRDHNWFKYFLRRFVAVAFGKSRMVRKTIRFLDLFVPADPFLLSIIKKYQPTAVLAPDIIQSSDRAILRAAKKSNVKTIGMVRSWDNLTAKGVIQVMPDYLIAQTHAMKREAIELGDMPPERVLVCGVSQFDVYWEKPVHTREEFLSSLGIPSNRRLILCAPFYGEFSQNSGIMLIQELAKAVDDGRLPSDIQLLVRYRPEDLNSTNAPESLNHPRITVTKPYKMGFGETGGHKDFEFTQNDVDLLADSLRHSEITLTTISTLTVDAVALDKPVVNVRFDIDPNTPLPYRVELFSHFDHYLALEKTGGMKLAHSLEELLAELNAYLENPALDSLGRAQIRREQIEFEDAHSGKRSAEAILSLL